LLLAESLSGLRRFEESRRIYEALLTDSPHIAAAHYGMGRALAGLGRAREALASFRTACELAPEAGAAHYALALAYRDAGEKDNARRHLEIFQSGNRATPQLPDPLMDRVLALAKDHHWYLNEGRRLDAAGHRQEAILYYEQAVAISPDFYQAHVNLLGAYGMSGNLAKAAEHYRRAAEINPNIPELHYNWGVFQASQNHHQEAEAAFRKALALNPQFADAHQNLGTTLEHFGRREEAIEHYRAALDHDPNHRVAHFHLGRAQVEQGRVAEGIRHLKQALSKEDLRSPYVHYALAMAYVRLDDASNATAHARKALELARKYGQHDFAESIEPDLDALEARARGER
jgi:tetratricopeptide (TPR) repeat protein